MAVEPGGNLVVSDSKRHTVMRFDPTGHLLSEWGPRLGDTLLAEPAGVAVQGDNFYVLDRGTPRIFRLDATGRLQDIMSLESFGTYGLNGLAVDPAGTSTPPTRAAIASLCWRQMARWCARSATRAPIWAD